VGKEEINFNSSLARRLALIPAISKVRLTESKIIQPCPMRFRGQPQAPFAKSRIAVKIRIAKKGAAILT
jgi:hypothetical protein